MNVVRTREGQPFDPASVEEDYQRIFDLKRFSNVEAKVEPTTSGGVIIIFIVTEERLIKSIAIRGNLAIDTKTLSDTISMPPREGDRPVSPGGSPSNQLSISIKTKIINILTW